MTVKPLSESSCEFRDAITVFETQEYLAFVAKSGVPAEHMKAGVKQALDAHNAEETPSFAKSIERKALSEGHR
jgi:hypothetical protein